MEKKYCVACGCAFRPRPQNPTQSYCPAQVCQRERRRCWQRDKRHDDPDYRDNQQRAQQAWCRRNPDYWCQYRRKAHQHVEINGARQSKRHDLDSSNSAVKMDSSAALSALPSGTYLIRRMAGDNPVKMDVWTVEITVISTG